MLEKKYNASLIPCRLQYECDDAIALNMHEMITDDDNKFIINHLLDNCNDIKLNNYSSIFVANSQELSDNIQYNNAPDITQFTTKLQINDGYIGVEAFNNEQLPNIVNLITTNFDTLQTFQIKIDTITDTCSIFYTINNTQYIVDPFLKCAALATNTSNTHYPFILSEDKLYIFDPCSKQTLELTIDEPYNSLKFSNANIVYDTVSGNVLNAYEDQQNNMLINAQYTDIQNNTLSCNILTLKNQKTYTDRDEFSNYWRDVNNSKTFHNIQTGTNQEQGNLNVATVSELYASDITIEPGYNTIHIPADLYPYKCININDTTFSKSGAFGGAVPSISDRIYIQRYNDDNTILLCAWLSSNIETGESVWLDRYYNPLAATEREILSLKSENIITKNYERYQQLAKYGFYDQQSTVTLSANQDITYYHITTDDITNYINELNSTALTAVTYANVNRKHMLSADTFTVSGDMYGITPLTTTIQSKNSFALSIGVDMKNWQKAQFYDLISTQSNNCGLRLYKKNTLTPILHTWYTTDSTTIITLYDTQFTQIDEIIIEGVAKNVFRDDNLLFFVIQFENSVRITTLFGGTIHEFVEERPVRSCFYKDNKILIAYATITGTTDIYIYNAFNFDVISTANYIIPNGYDILFENEQIICENTNTKCYGYIPGFGLMFVGQKTILNDSVTSTQYNILQLATQSYSPLIANNSANAYIDLISNKQTVNLITTWDQFELYDFAVNDNTLYTCNLEKFITCNIDRTNMQMFDMPIHTKGANSKCYVYTTNEIIDNKFTANVYIIIETDVSEESELYQFKDNKFIKIKTLHNIKGKNLYNPTGKKYLPGFQNDLYMELMFKEHKNKIAYYTQKVDSILPGMHTLLFNVDNINSNCKLYVDGVVHCDISFNEENGPRSYTHSYDITQNQLVLGNTLLYNGGELASYIKSKNYLLKDVTFSNVCIFDAPLTAENIRINMLNGKTIPTILFNLPTGQYCEVSQINQFYKQTVPGYKSTDFDLMVKNLRLSSKNKQLLSKRLKQHIASMLPAITNLNNVVYKDY